MYKMVAFIVTMIIVPSAFTAPTFQEGVNYEVRAKIGSAKPEVLVFFSYFCPGCAKIEPVINELKNSLPENVIFKKNHVAFLGRDMGPLMQKAYATAYILKVDERMTSAIFQRMQQRQYPRDRSDVEKIFVENGIPAESFDATFDSFPVASMVSQFNRNTDSYKIRAAPSFLINGKYMIKLESISSQAQLNQLVSFLLVKNY